jgi:hypothetical protein
MVQFCATANQLLPTAPLPYFGKSCEKMGDRRVHLVRKLFDFNLLVYPLPYYQCLLQWFKLTVCFYKLRVSKAF